jgi:hypothetical protein
MKAAMERTYGRQFEQAQQGFTLSSMISDKQLEQQRQTANARLATQRHMFDRDMAMQQQQFDMNRPSDFEMAVGTVLPYATEGYAAYKDKQATKEYEQTMQALLDKQAAGYREDMGELAIDYAANPIQKTLANANLPSLPRQMLQQTAPQNVMQRPQQPFNPAQLQYRHMQNPLPSNYYDPYRARFGGN